LILELTESRDSLFRECGAFLVGVGQSETLFMLRLAKAGQGTCPSAPVAAVVG
jgi:hypothetical protein